jgi:predicted alpha/beta-fold hydrolase
MDSESLAGMILMLSVVYIAIGYVIYDELSSITPGRGENGIYTSSAFKMTYKEWPDINEAPYFLTNYRTIRFPCPQAQLMLAGWYVLGDHNASVVILTHGVNSCICDPIVLTVAGMLHRYGFNVPLYDMRKNGQSEIENGRTAISSKEYQDVLMPGIGWSR